MSPSRRGSGVARLALLCLAAVVVGCSANPVTGALKVEVVLQPGLVSRCVKVTVTDGMVSRETNPIALAGKTSPLDVGIAANGLSQPVTVQALGFSDEGCTTRTPGEESETAMGEFTKPVSTVTLTLRPVSNGDGGFDGGTDAGMDAGSDGGMDAGMDAGVDNDSDNYPDSVDCDDNDPTVNPGRPEICSNGKDDDCSMQTDCQQNSCAGMTCAGNGTCMSNTCVALTESVCNDGMDNNGDGLIDCADPDCPVNTICNDNNICTTGDQCVSGNSCAGTPFTCNSPPAPQQCWNGGGVCVPDGGAPTCVYTPTVGNMCNDGLACTMGEACSNGACTGGTMMPCTSPPGVCFATTGTCQEPSATCAYAPLAAGTGTCSDSNNCTTNDRCAGDGGCAGTAVTCNSPNQCQNASTSCEVDGGCIYPPRTNQTCDAGTGPGTCNGTATCVPNPATIFPNPPSNFTESQLPADAGMAFTVSCATTINTSGTPSITSTCISAMPPHAVINQTGGGEQAVLIRVPSLTVNSSQVLTITGTRPVIFAVTGDVLISGTIRANNPGTPADCGNGGNGGAVSGLGGGGGGGFGSAGGAGGVRTAGGAGTAGGPNGFASLAPLRGGCQGGNGSGTGGAGASGGGALQIVARGTLTVASSGIVTAQGKGGAGGTGTDSSGGGGGSGGGILLEAALIALNSSSWVSANGGGGGGGEDMGTNGGNGNDGPESSLTGANGGAGPGNAGEGGDGATRTSLVQNGQNTADNDGAGGGGGGMGRIRLNGGSCSIDSAANRSPEFSGNGVGSCPMP